MAYLDSTKLAYLIEISLVLNLAYLELKSFNIAHSIKNKIKEYTERYAGMQDAVVKGTLSEQQALHATHTALMDFHKGVGDGWVGERRKNNIPQNQQNGQRIKERRQKACYKFRNAHCFFLRLYYKWLLPDCLDRTIAKIFLVSVVLILIAITWIEADHKQQTVSACLVTVLGIDWNAVFWSLLFPTVVVATIYPAIMMFLSRNLVHFVTGSREEDYEKNAECGRLHQLGRGFLLNFQKLSVDSLKKEYQQTVEERR